MKKSTSVCRPEKKRKVSPNEVLQKPNFREPLSLISPNLSTEEVFQCGSMNGHEESAEIMMTTSEIESLLNTRMTGKAKHDTKGKLEQMMDYIKKLRACSRFLLKKEAGYIEHNKQLMDEIEEHKRKQEEIVSTLKLENQKLEDEMNNLKAKCLCLEKELVAVNDKEKELQLQHDSDLEALHTAEEKEQKLAAEIEQLKVFVTASNDQIKSLNDMNRRLTEYNTSLQVYNTKLQNDVAAAAEETMKIKQDKAAIVETLGTVRVNATTLQAQLDKAKESLLEGTKERNALAEQNEQLRMELQNVKAEREQCFIQIQVLTEENANFKDFNVKSANEMKNLASKARALEESAVNQFEEIQRLQQQLRTANEKLKMTDEFLAQQRQQGAGYISKVQDLQARLAAAEHHLNEGEALRRKLHNTIQELKGNIRVFCRVRPLLADEALGSDIPIVDYPTSMDLQGHGIELIEPQHGQKYSFSFDKVFGPEATQKDVFIDVSQLVQSALDGYKVCIFAYGQTGSGKTYTMLGDPNEALKKGLIPRSLEQIFQASQTLRSQGWNFTMQASMLEIYNETIRDLVTTRTNSQDPAKQHVVKHDANGNTTVSDLTLVQVTNWDEVSSLLKQAAQSRTVGMTAMNEQSSRSHCVFTLRIAGVNENTEQQVHGVLNLVDLAGSERLSKSGATGERLKETQAINKSLASLGNVILAIANKEQHVPYRNSKLTYLLQPCLGGDSKTLMFVNISPDNRSFNESLCSLRFAAKVNACEIGVPRRHTLSRISDTNSRVNTSTN